MNKKYLMFMLLVVLSFVFGISNASAVTISDTGAYAVGFSVDNGDIDGFTNKIVKFDFEAEETSVTLSDLVEDSVVFLQGYTLTGWLDGDTPVTSFTKNEIINSSFSFDDGDLLSGKMVTATYDSEEEIPLYDHYLTLYTGIGLLDGKQYTNILKSEDGFEFDLEEYAPVKEGYTFKGWYYKSIDEENSLVKFVKKDGIIDIEDFVGDVTCLKLIAAWESDTLDVNKKQYVLDANNGVYFDSTTSKAYNMEYYSSGDDFVITGEVPTRDGYVFDGWSFNSDGTGYKVEVLDYFNYIDYDCEDFCEDLNSITLYATWKPGVINDSEGEYAFLFKTLDNYSNIDGFENVIVKFNILEGATSVRISDLLNSTPFYKGSSFLGWSYNGNIVTEISEEDVLNGGFTYDGNDYTGIELSAVFGDDTTIDLSKYYLNLYSGIGLTDGQRYINVNDTTNDFSVDLNNYVPVKEGYTFKGWYQHKYNAIDMENYYEKVTNIVASDFSADRYNNVDLIAGWQSNSVDQTKSTYTLHGNGGTINGDTDKTYNFELNNDYDSYVFAFDIPVRDGYKFLGWKDRTTGSYVTYIDGNDDKTSYDFDAQWQRLTYTGVTSKVSANLYGYDDVKVSWNKVSDASYYRIYYKKSTSLYYTYLAQTSYLYKNVANLTDGAKYYFKIVAVKKDGNSTVISSKYRYASVYTLKKINTPTVGKYSKYYVRVKWNNISGESGYEIARSRYKTKNFYIVKRVNYTYSSSVIKTSRGYTYYYKVRAYKTVDGKKVYGPWSYLKSYKLR